MPCPGSRLAMSSVYSPKSASSTEIPRASRDLLVAAPQPDRDRSSGPVGAVRVRADDPVREHDQHALARPRRGRAGAAARGRGPGPPWSRTGAPPAEPSHRHLGVPQRGAGGVADDEVRRRAEPVLVERVAADGERVVDADRLAGDLGAVLVDGQVGREVGRAAGVEARRLEVDVLDQQQVRPSRCSGPSATRPPGRRAPARRRSAT